MSNNIIYFYFEIFVHLIQYRYQIVCIYITLYYLNAKSIDEFMNLYVRKKKYRYILIKI